MQPYETRLRLAPMLRLYKDQVHHTTRKILEQEGLLGCVK